MTFSGHNVMSLVSQDLDFFDNVSSGLVLFPSDLVVD